MESQDGTPGKLWVLGLCAVGFVVLAGCGGEQAAESQNVIATVDVPLSAGPSTTPTDPGPAPVTSDPPPDQAAPAAGFATDYCTGARQLTQVWVEYVLAASNGSGDAPAAFDTTIQTFESLAPSAPAELAEAYANAINALRVQQEMLVEVDWDQIALTTEQHDALNAYNIDGRDPLEVIGEHHRESCDIDVDAYFEEVFGDVGEGHDGP